MIQTNEFYKQIGQRIKLLRSNAQLTQDDLAQRIGLTRTSITYIESGRQRVQVHTLCAIAEALRVPVNELLPPSSKVDEDVVCQICGFDYGAVYGKAGENFVIGYQVQPVSDLAGKRMASPKSAIIVCANCHRFLSSHPEMTAAELKKIMKKTKASSIAT